MLTPMSDKIIIVTEVPYEYSVVRSLPDSNCCLICG